MGRRGGVLTVHGYKGRKNGILTVHGQRALCGILTGQRQERCIDMKYVAKVVFSPLICRRDAVLIGHGQERWCTDCIRAVDMATD